MGILSGALAAQRFDVVGDLPPDWREVTREALNQFAFKEPSEFLGPVAVEGWVQVHNLLYADFSDFNQWLYDPFALFSFRRDVRQIPAKLLAATVQSQCKDWCLEHGQDQCPSSVRDDLKEQLVRRWMKQVLPRISIVEMAWNMTENYVLITSLSSTMTERVRRRFYQTFGLKLQAATPLTGLEQAAALEHVVSVSPMKMTHGGL